ncbi:MAG: phosphodiester glycosidase family protein [Polyangiaceae bacterium]
MPSPFRTDHVGTALLAAAALLVASTADAKPGAGTVEDPLVVDAFPYIVEGTTLGAASVIDGYECAAADESGGEVVYRFTLEAPARVTAWLAGDGGGVDVDVHLVGTLAPSGGTAGCVARGNQIAEANMEAGEHWVVVDTFDGAAQEGPFVLHLEAVGDTWIERPIAQGVTWRARRFGDLGGKQVVHALDIDVGDPEVRIEALPSDGCQTTGSLGAEAGAVAGVNAGFFALDGQCSLSSMLIHDGQTFKPGDGRGAFGLTADMEPLIDHVSGDWPEVEEAQGGGPVLVETGTPHQGDWADQGYTNAAFNGKNPRTLAGVGADGHVLFGTVDGRRPSATGMSLDELASYAASELGATGSVNLDGGGSTTMWIAGRTPNGVLNHPSDNADAEEPTHSGSRPNSGGFFVFAPKYDHPPRFQTEPVEDAQAGEPYSYDADAIDLDVDDVVAFSLKQGPDGMTVDAESGTIAYAPTEESPESVEVVLVAQGGDGAAAEQTWVLSIVGAHGPPEGTGGSGGSAGSGSGGGGGGLQADGDGALADDGCGCRLAGAHRSREASLVLLMAVGALLARRRVRARVSFF